MSGGRKYKKTHPWITFKHGLKNAGLEFWMLLGEAQAKCKHIAESPLLPDSANRFQRIYLTKGVLATTAIEGNTLSEEQVRSQIEGNLALPHSRGYMGLEVDNIVTVSLEILMKVMAGQNKGISVPEIKRLNRQILEGLNPEEDVIPGKIRLDSVGVGRYKGAPPEDCEFLLEKLCKWLNDSDVIVGEGYEIANGIVKAALAHLYIAWIHPFGDGNGRTARMIEFQLLMASGVSFASAWLLSNHFNLTREKYYSELDKTSKSHGDILPFYHYVLQGFIDGLNEQGDAIKEEHFDALWLNLVYDLFRDFNTMVGLRRRRLVVDLYKQPEPVPVSKVRHVSPRIAEAYAGKTMATIRRDIRWLVEKQLIRVGKSGVEVRRDIMSTPSSPLVAFNRDLVEER